MALISCKECGEKLSTTANACPHCGATQQIAGSRLAFTSLVLGVLSFFYSLGFVGFYSATFNTTIWLCGLALSGLATFLGVASMFKNFDLLKEAIAGLVTGSVSIIINLMLFFIFV